MFHQWWPLSGASWLQRFLSKKAVKLLHSRFLGHGIRWSCLGGCFNIFVLFLHLYCPFCFERVNEFFWRIRVL